MKFILYSDRAYEPWDYNTPDTTGIGGSEVAHIETSWRLARRGYEVLSYAPIKPETQSEWRKTKWIHHEKADFSQEDAIWIVYRNPAIVDKLPKNAVKWLVCQDVDYPEASEEQWEKWDQVIGLCQDHIEHLEKTHPCLKGKTWKWRNGVRSDLIRKIEAEGIQRDSKRILYASSPDRGLEELLEIFRSVKVWQPDAQLHACYGWQNIDKMQHYPKLLRSKERILKAFNQRNVTYHGRLSNPDLIRMWFATGIWCYPTNFTETSCITSMESQACGVFPITRPYWALRENVMYGVLIHGDSREAMTQQRYVMECVRACSGNFPMLYDGINHPYRSLMQTMIRMNFDWDRVIDIIEARLLGLENRWFFGQNIFQMKHRPSAPFANIGCDMDTARLKELGAVNIDFIVDHPTTHRKPTHDYLADARVGLPKEIIGKMEGAVLGDILEHMTDDEAVAILKNAKAAMHNGGNIVITCPDDRRNLGWTDSLLAVGYKGHSPVPKARLDGWLERAGLKVKHYEPLEYGFSDGHGVICS